MQKYTFREKGFTLVEILVVISIIGLLVAVVTTSMTAARSNSRDKIRLVDIEQLRLSFKLYDQYFGEYPLYDAGVALGVGEGIDTDLASIEIDVPADPTHDGVTYMYVYDSNFDCAGVSHKVIYINNFETLKSTSNAESVCGPASDAVEGQFIVLLE